jgi:heme-degrading monooxygenase HmoA
MYVHIWRMKGKKKKAEDYEKFGRQVTLPALKKLDGCVHAHFIRVFEARKPEYLWLVFWRDKEALEAARGNPAWRDQIKKFEAGKFYKTIPLELVCESLGWFGGPSEGKSKKSNSSSKRTRSGKSEEPEEAESSEGAESSTVEAHSKAFVAPTVEGE